MILLSPNEIVERLSSMSYGSAVLAFRRWYVAQLIAKHQGNMSRAAQYARMDRSGFRRLARHLGVWVPKAAS